METKKEEATGFSGRLTLGQLLLAVPVMVNERAVAALDGPMWTVRASDGSYAPQLLRAAALSYLSQAMVEYSRLRCWTEANEYARSLTIRQILTTFTLGSLVTFMLMDCLVNAFDCLDQWAWQNGERGEVAAAEQEHLF